MEGNSKVSVDSKLKAVVKRTIEKDRELETIFKENPEALKVYKEIVKETKDPEKV